MLENILSSLYDTKMYREFMLKKIKTDEIKNKQKFLDLVNSIPDCNTEQEYNKTFT
jgi:hypothetical protein